MTRYPFHLLQAEQLSAEGLVAADGTLWAHACTVGQYTRGTVYNLDRATITNFVRNFTSGYPKKVPLDYEHSSISDDPVVREARAKGDIPKAGDVVEMKAVFSAADFTGDLLEAAKKLTAKANRPLEDERNLGLWIRLKPTAKALAKVQAGELNDLSITFVDDWEDKSTGKGQGPTLLSVAMCMMPFLDDMLPMAASQGEAGGRRSYDPGRVGDPASTAPREEHMTGRTINMLAAVAALVAQPVATDEEAVSALTALTPEIARLRKLGAMVAERFGGETDPDKVAAKLNELATQVTTFQAQAAAAKEKAIETEVEGALKEHEDKIVPAVRDIFKASLTSELKGGKPLKECPTYMALSTLPKHGLTTQGSQADTRSTEAHGDNSSDPDALLERKKEELLASDPEVKALTAKPETHQQGVDLAYDKAAAAIKYQSQQQLRVVGR